MILSRHSNDLSAVDCCQHFISSSRFLKTDDVAPVSSPSECEGGGICVHGRMRRWCKECEGSGLCVHSRARRLCKECEGSGLCVHGRARNNFDLQRNRSACPPRELAAPQDCACLVRMHKTNACAAAQTADFCRFFC